MKSAQPVPMAKPTEQTAPASQDIMQAIVQRR